MRGSRKFLREGPNLITFFFFFFFKWIGDPNTAINGPTFARQQNAIEMAFCWWADDGPTLNAGLVALWIWTSIAKQPYIFVIFQGG